jgi:hypothetical protein
VPRLKPIKVMVCFLVRKLEVKKCAKSFPAFFEFSRASSKVWAPPPTNSLPKFLIDLRLSTLKMSAIDFDPPKTLKSPFLYAVSFI